MLLLDTCIQFDYFWPVIPFSKIIQIVCNTIPKSFNRIFVAGENRDLQHVKVLSFFKLLKFN